MGNNSEPLIVTAGDTVRWVKGISPFYVDELLQIEPIDDAWALSYQLRAEGSKNITINASISGTNYQVTVLPVVTALWTAAEYTWDAYLTKTTDRYRVDRGRMEVLTDLATSSNYDGRSIEEIELAHVNEALNSEAKHTISSHTVGGHSISKVSRTDLIAHRDRLLITVNAQRRRRALGNSRAGTTIKARF